MVELVVIPAKLVLREQLPLLHWAELAVQAVQAVLLLPQQHGQAGLLVRELTQLHQMLQKAVFVL